MALGVESVVSWLQGRRSLYPANTKALSSRFAFPQTHEEWLERYSWLEDAYLGEAYSQGDVTALHLFRALDTAGDEIATTRRLTRDVQHVVDTDAQALSQGLVLELDGDDAKRLAEGAAIWRAGGTTEQVGTWARRCVSLGDVFIEPVRRQEKRPYGVRLIGYDPRQVRTVYDDQTGTVIVEATITTDYYEPPKPGESVRDQVAHAYRRVLTPTEIAVTLDGEPVEEESGPHGLGVVPLAHAQCIPWTDPDHGLWAAVGLESALAYVDSVLTQAFAVGNRYGNPLLVVRGAKLTATSDVHKFGRVISGVPADGSVEIVEASLEQIRALLAAADQARAMARETLPEFLFTDAGASASGRALNFRASAFAAKVRDMRDRFYGALTTATAYAVAMEADRPYDPDDAAFRVDAPPALPVNTAEEVEVLHGILDHDGLTHADYVRHLQRLGIVPRDADPDEYAIATLDQRGTRAREFFRAPPDKTEPPKGEE